MPDLSRSTESYLLLSHIQHTSVGIGHARQRRRFDPAAWIVSGALVALSLLIVAFAGN